MCPYLWLQQPTDDSLRATPDSYDHVIINSYVARFGVTVVILLWGVEGRHAQQNRFRISVYKVSKFRPRPSNFQAPTP